MVKLTLKAARTNKKLSQKTASKLIGISEETLRSYELGRSFPDVPIIKKIEDCYGVEYKDLLFLTKNYGLTVK